SIEIPNSWQQLKLMEEVFIFGNPIPNWIPALPILKRIELVGAVDEKTKGLLRNRHPHLEECPFRGTPHLCNRLLKQTLLSHPDDFRGGADVGAGGFDGVAAGLRGTHPPGDLAVTGAVELADGLLGFLAGGQLQAVRELQLKLAVCPPGVIGD